MILNWNPSLGSLFKNTEDAQEEQMSRVGRKKKLEKDPSPQVATHISRLPPQRPLDL